MKLRRKKINAKPKGGGESMPCLRRTVISPRKKNKEGSTTSFSCCSVGSKRHISGPSFTKKAFLASKLQFTDTPSCLNTIYEGISSSSKLNSDVPDGKSSS